MVVCFNAGIWGYEEWQESILHAHSQRFVSCAYDSNFPRNIFSTTEYVPTMSVLQMPGVDH